MTKTSQLFALTLGLASVTAPVFAHDVDGRASDRVVAQRANTRMSVYDLNHDGRVTPSEVKRVKEQEEQARRREQLRRQEAAARARAHEQELARERARQQELARERARQQELARAHDDHHFVAPPAYR